MAKKVTVKLNSAGVQELLKSDAIYGACVEEAQKIKQRAGTGFEISSRSYPERKGAAVVAATQEARQQNYKENTLLKAMG